MKSVTEVLAAEAFERGRRRSWPRGLWLLVTVVLSAALVTTVFVVRDHNQHRTQGDWRFASEFAAQLEQSGDWRVGRTWAPCGHANPEAFIDLKATSEGNKPVARLRHQVEAAGWTMINTFTPDYLEEFAATTAEGRVMLVLEQVEAKADVELSVDERC